jgi:hypothetical protein
MKQKIMKHPVFWFANSGLTCSIIKRKICCCYKFEPIPTEFEWDNFEGPEYTTIPVQPSYISIMTADWNYNPKTNSDI